MWNFPQVGWANTNQIRKNQNKEKNENTEEIFKFCVCFAGRIFYVNADVVYRDFDK